MKWLFDNMRVAGITEKDAPSVGAYAYLMELREDKSRRDDFYKSLWPKLLAKEDAEKGGKLADTGKETIELLDTLLAALPEKVK